MRGGSRGTNLAIWLNELQNALRMDFLRDKRATFGVPSTLAEALNVYPIWTRTIMNKDYSVFVTQIMARR